MRTKINGIEQCKPVTREEIAWFSIIKKVASEVNFGSAEIQLTIKAGKIVYIGNVKTYNNYKV